MKFSNDTLNVLKNFSSINPSVLFKPGQTVRTISPQKTVMAAATIWRKCSQQKQLFMIYQGS